MSIKTVSNTAVNNVVNLGKNGKKELRRLFLQMPYILCLWKILSKSIFQSWTQFLDIMLILDKKGEGAFEGVATGSRQVISETVLSLHII